MVVMMTEQMAFWFQSPVQRALRWLAAWLLATLAVLATANPVAAKPAQILVVGDSLSAGYGLSAGEGWVDLLTKKLAREKITGQVINASISGDTTTGGLARLPALLAKHKPTLVVIELGGNDGLRGSPVAAAKANLMKMAELAKASGAKVLVVGMRMPPNFGPSYTAQFEAMYAEVAKAVGGGLVPFFLDRIGTDLSKFQADKIHPTAAAQPELLDTVWPALAKLLR